MDVRSKLKIWATANDDFIFPEYAFPAQSLIRQRVGFFDLDVPGMWHCNMRIRSAMSHYQLKMDNVDRPDLYDDWKTFRKEGIERALTDLEDELQRQGIQVS